MTYQDYFDARRLLVFFIIVEIYYLLQAFKKPSKQGTKTGTEINNENDRAMASRVYFEGLNGVVAFTVNG